MVRLQTSIRSRWHLSHLFSRVSRADLINGREAAFGHVTIQFREFLEAGTLSRRECCWINDQSHGAVMNRLLIIGLLLIAMLPLSAHGQQPNAAKTKALAENVVKIIGGDKAKLRAYCQINSLSNSTIEAIQEKNNEKAEELFERIDELEKQLGPEYHTLFNALYDADPNSKDTQEIFSMLDRLDESCPH